MTELKYSDQELIDMLHLASSDESKSDGMLYRIAARRICECMKRDANYWHRIMQRSDLQAYKIRELEAKLERVMVIMGLVAEDVLYLFHPNEPIDTEDWPFQMAVLVNDTFYIASADSEIVPLDKLNRVISIYGNYGWDGITAWVAFQRNKEPLERYRTKKYKKALKALKDNIND